MKNSENTPKLDANGFGLIDFIIIGLVLGIMVFIIISNIIAQSY
jgi:competence protein ComGC